MAERMREVRRIAVVGLGSIGRRHLRVLKQLRPEVEVVLVRSGKGARWPEEAMAKTIVTSIDDAITTGIDAAILSTPAPFHLSHAMALTRVGIPLLIEKPLSDTMVGLERLKHLAEQTQAPILIGYVLRYSPGARCFYKMVQDRRAGEPLSASIECGSYLPDWRPGQDYRTTPSAQAKLGGGVLLELSHELDYANWFFGPFKNVSAKLENSGEFDIDVEDIAELTLSSRAAISVSLKLDFCRRDPIRRCILTGSDGILTWDGVQEAVSWSPRDRELEQWFFDIERDVIFRTQMIHFLDCIENGDAPFVTLDDGIAAVTLVEAAKKSHHDGKVIEL
jgi:predicted dehydrogenase